MCRESLQLDRILNSNYSYNKYQFYGIFMKKLSLITLYYVNLKLPFLIFNEKYSHTKSNITNFTFSMLD